MNKALSGFDSHTLPLHWDNLFKRIKEDKKEVEKLPVKHLRKTGANFIRHMKVANAVGSTICYAYMQAVGMVNDHLVGCFRHGEVARLAPAPCLLYLPTVVFGTLIFPPLSDQ